MKKVDAKGGGKILKKDGDCGIDHVADPDNVDKAVLLYSGGLDTSCMVKYIQEQYGAEVITLTIDLGQPGIDLDEAKKKALDQGAKKAHVVDAKEEFAEEYISKAIKANGMYQGYPLSTAIARYLICEKAVEIANNEGADAIVHGSTGKGNDQVRFEAGILSLDPEMKVLAPVREWSMTRDKEVQYAEKHGIDVESQNSTYSTDENLWGKSSECGPLEDPGTEPPEEVFKVVKVPEEAPDKPEYMEIEFENGVPVSLDGKEMKIHELVDEVNGKAGKHGIGIIDVTEDRVVGLKSREIYECPAAVSILKAHQALEKYCSTKHENQMKKTVDNKWSEMTYNGLWFDPLMDSLNAFIDSMNENVTGTVKLKLYKGKVQVVGRESVNGLYDHSLASYDEGETFNQEASPGFIQLWSLQTKLSNKIAGGNQ